jgi:hypothetical protein
MDVTALRKHAESISKARLVECYVAMAERADFVLSLLAKVKGPYSADSAGYVTVLVPMEFWGVLDRARRLAVAQGRSTEIKPNGASSLSLHDAKLYAQDHGL